MRRAQAVRHLAAMADTATENLSWRDGPVGWPLSSLWVAGELLGPALTIEHADVVLLLDVPPEELPWLALHPAGESVSSVLGLGKRPVLWCYRPHVWPAWNARHGRVARFWSEGGGADDEVLEALRAGRSPAVTEPSAEERRTQLHEELAVARPHLRYVLDHFHDRSWRRAHAADAGPEERLWRAAQGLREIEDALGS